MKLSSLAFTVVFIICAVGIAQADVKPVGIVKTVKQQAHILRDKETLEANVGQKVYLRDLLQTGPDGGMGVIFHDDTVISMGPDSRIMVESFLFEPVQGKLSFILNMVQGAASFLTGQIGKISPKSVKVKTPVGTVGIRGTYFLIKVKGR